MSTINVDFSNLTGFTVLQGETFDTDLFSEYHIEVQVNSGFTVDTVPTLHIVSSSTGTEDIQLVLKSDTTDVYYYDVENMTQNITRVYVDGLAKSANPKPQPTTILNVDFSNLTGFTVLQGNTFDTTLFSNYYIEVQVNSGFTVLNVPTLHIVSSSSGTDDIQLVLKSDTTDVYYYDIENTTKNITSVYVDGLAQSSVQSLYNDYPLITCYKVDSSIMQDVASVRFQTQSGDTQDLGKYILSVVRYPCNIDTLNNIAIKLGFFQTNIKADLIEKQINEFSLGKVLITGIEQNTSDIEKTIIDIMLPFFGVFNLNSKFINTEIEVIYKIDIVTNNCVIEIYSDDVLTNQIECVIGYDLPYIIKENSQSIIANNMLNSNILKQNAPCVYVRQKPKETNTFYTTNKVTDNLNNIQGFIRCTDYYIGNIPTEMEKDLIEKLMIKGVYI